MLEEHPAEAVNCSRTNMSDKQRQPTNISNTAMAQMGSSSKGPSCTPNEFKVNNNKDASNGAVTKSGRAPRYGGGKRRSGSKWAGNKGDPNFSQGAGQNPATFDGKSSRSQNLRKYQTGHGNYEASPRQPHYNNFQKVMKEDEFEAGSIFNPGSKKQNLSHLLNFQYEPRGNKNK